MVGHELFEKIIDIIESKSSGVNSTFRPASARMDAIAHLHILMHRDHLIPSKPIT